MNDDKYIGLDVHQATISVAVLDSVGKVVMESIVETKAESILQCLRGLRGSLHVTFEEGICRCMPELSVCESRRTEIGHCGDQTGIDVRAFCRTEFAHFDIEFSSFPLP